VSGHVAAVHIGSFLRRGNPDPRMSLVGQTRSFGDVGFDVTAAPPSSDMNSRRFIRSPRRRARAASAALRGRLLWQCSD
jgi:hypothetical protein